MRMYQLCQGVITPVEVDGCDHFWVYVGGKRRHRGVSSFRRYFEEFEAAKAAMLADIDADISASEQRLQRMRSHRQFVADLPVPQ